MITWQKFNNLIVGDYEFTLKEGEIPLPLCYVAKNLVTGDYYRHWITGEEKTPKYPIDDKSLFIAYMLNAEMRCHLALNFNFPIYKLDLFPEFRSMTNGLKLPFENPKDGASLLNVCNFFGIHTPGVDYKHRMRERILKGPPFTEKEKQGILDYCQTDVDITSELFLKLKNRINLLTALFHGEYMGAVARIENLGIPLNIEKFQKLRECYEIIIDELIWRINPEYGFFEKEKDTWHFRKKLFAEYLVNQGIPWNLTPTGWPVTSSDYIGDQAEIYPQLKHFSEVKRAMDQLKLKDFPVGKDGRNRASLMPFRAKTMRNAPSSAKYIFSPSVWLRNLIEPPEGYALSYIDFSQEEVAIAAQLSRDPNLLADYKSGDVYLAFGKYSGIIPPDGDKKTHSKERDMLKPCFLGMNYGQSSWGLAAKLKISLYKAKTLSNYLKGRYSKFNSWIESFIDTAIFKGFAETKWGWKFFTKNVDRINTLRNWPMQTVGAEILQLAVCLCFQNDVEVIAPVHDALLIQGSISEIDEKIKVAKQCMEDASEYVLGLRIRTDAKTVIYPEHYNDPRGDWMWQKIWEILDNMNPAELQARIYEKSFFNISLEDFESEHVQQTKNISKRRQGQLLMKPASSSEKAMIARIKKYGKFNHAQIMKLVRTARDTDFDLEAEIDWKYDTFETALTRIKHKTSMKQILGETTG